MRPGATHAFGNTEARLIRKVLGVKARDGAERWDSVRGTGAVRAHRGDYHDALHVKRNTILLLVHSIFGGFARGAVSHLRSLAKRPVDKTEFASCTRAPGSPTSCRTGRSASRRPW